MLRLWRPTLHILGCALRHRIDLIVPTGALPKLVRLLLVIVRPFLRSPKAGPGERLRAFCVELGPVYIKLGQLLSTRHDLLDPDLAKGLAQLQDQVPAIEDFDICGFVSEQLDAGWEGFFAELEQQPLACASIAQVHAGTLPGGERVVVKAVRPDAKQQIDQDMSFVVAAATFIDQHILASRRFHLPRLMRDHWDVLRDELDMLHEARNQTQLRRNFAESNLLYVPRVYDALTRPHMLVMERVEGVPIGNIEELAARGVNFKVLAHKGVETFFTQVFVHNFFHADMHPGNILIDTTDPQDPRYIALDCAIVGTLPERDQKYLALNLVAFFRRDYAEVARLFKTSGWIPYDADPEEFEAVIREVCDPIFAKPLAEISFAEFVVKLFRTAGQFNMELQPQLALLQKTLLYIEGLGRALYPQLDLWQTAQPFVQRWVADRLNPLTAIIDWLSSGPDSWQSLLRLPETIETLQHDVASLETRVARQNLYLQTHMSGRGSQRLKRYSGAGLILASLILLWRPLWEGISTGDDISMLAGIVSALLGSALVVRT